MRLAHLLGRDEPLAVVAGDRVAALAGRVEGVSTVDDVLARWPEVRDELEAAAAAALRDDSVALEPGNLDVPLRRFAKVACVGLNYADHIRETGLEAPARPLIFAKFASSVVAGGVPIRWPEGLTTQVDWEAELTVVIGRRMRDVAPEQALDGVFGYTVANDVSARDLQFADVQWVRAKSIDTFCPLGPVVVTADEFGDPQAKGIVSRVNGEVMQDSNTSEMIFSAAEIISFLSHSCTLEPGDLILTGTPWGVGGFRTPPIFLEAGDVVEVEVEGIGVLSNPIAGPAPA
jgi:2-keto-4-pentenoate hydratase/2-oxohepta-3-ene-1,7-dioic acid hydratase in catechol pathway